MSSAPRVTRDLVPPAIADERGRAFGETMARAIADPDFTALLFERIDTVNASLLPFLIREFSVEEFVEPDMTETVIRQLLKAAYELHAAKGFIYGVRRGLLMLGMRVVWKQWFQKNPKGAAGTHTATVFVNQSIFNGQQTLIDERVQRAALRMIDGMKRWSQHVDFALAANTMSNAGVASAAQAAALAAPAMRADPLTEMGSDYGLSAALQSASLAVLTGDASSSEPLASGYGIAAIAQGAQFITAKMEASLQ